MGAKIYLSIIFVAALSSTAMSTLLCYDCDAGTECEEPAYFNVRVVNCEKQYPNALQNNNLLCLALDVKLTEGRGFSFYKSGIYRGCKVIPKGEEATFCDNLKASYADRLHISSCKFCNSTRCIP